MSEVGHSSGSGAGLALDIDLRKVGRLVGPYCPVPVGHLAGNTDSDWSQCCERPTQMAEWLSVYNVPVEPELGASTQHIARVARAASPDQPH